jgi:alpha-ketoglutarate-dependent taurine dioxygenase
MYAKNAVRFTPLDSNRAFLLLAQPTINGVSLLDWSCEHRDKVQESLAEHGAILFRGFEVNGQTEFESVVDCLLGKKLDYIYRTTPRTQVGKGVYTATEFPPHLTIPFHNENSYQRDWPMNLAFFCVKAADEGGETPIADTVGVTSKIDQGIKDKFRRKQIMYVRNYRPGFDLPWQTVFQSDDKNQVEAYCHEHDITCEWKTNDRLRTQQVCHAVAIHPRTGQEIWFNQAHMFHISALEEKTRRALLGLYGEEGLPRNAYYGDGERIEEEALLNIREAFKVEASVFRWQPQDLLLLDNMLVSHSRNAYKGERKILVSMANPYSTTAKVLRTTA